MKNVIFRTLLILAGMTFCAANASAQGFFDRIGKGLDKVGNALETVNEVLGTDTQPTDTLQVTAEDSVAIQETLAELPSYRVVQLVETDANGDTIRNEDQTVRYTYRVLNQNDEVCDPNTAKKHLQEALKSGGLVLAKVTGGALGGGELTKLFGDSELGKWIGRAGGAILGAFLARDDIKNFREQLGLRKDYLRLVSDYQKTFTDEGVPVDASADLSDYEDCETISRPAELVAQELLASREEGSTMDELSEDDWNIKL